jgi:hypothetical protein
MRTRTSGVQPEGPHSRSRSAVVSVGEADTARLRCRKKFLRVFPKGFQDPKYLSWERDYKWAAHERWEELLSRDIFEGLLADKDFATIAQRVLSLESRTNLLFSFEKMAIRDAVRTPDGARTFALALHRWSFGNAHLEDRFDQFVEAVEQLPRKQTRVLTWPVVTVFGFLARPDEHIFLKPQVTKAAAAAYNFPFTYASRPNWDTYQQLLDFADQLKHDLADLRPRDMIDIQSFIWVLGSPEYA